MAARLSLRTRLLIFVLLAICGVLALSEWNDYRSAGATARLVHDTILAASARAIAEQIRVEDGVVEAVIPPSALERLSTAQRDRVFYRVTSPGGELLAGYGDMPGPPSPVGMFGTVWYDAVFRAVPIRAVAVGRPLPGERRDFATVVVGETVNGRQAMVDDLWAGTLWRELATWGIVASLAFVALKAGLAPLMRLRRVILDRDPHSLARLDPRQVPSELRPFIAALDAAIARVSDQIGQKQRLLVDAAHQLRTPLAVLRTQAAVGLRSAGEAPKDEALLAVAATANDMSRLTDQLLLLARIEAAGDAGRHKPAAADMIAATRNVVVAQGHRALERDIDLTLDGPESAAGVPGEARMFGELVANLLDNALRYTPAFGAVAVRLGLDGEGLRLRVADTGPGIPEAERGRVFERFYRIPGSPGDGSGLGLSIAHEIAQAHGARLELSAPRNGTGLVVDVLVPAPHP